MRHPERDRGRDRDDYPVRAMGKEPDETRVLPGTRNVVYDQQGTVYGHCPRTGRCRPNPRPGEDAAAGLSGAGRDAGDGPGRVLEKQPGKIRSLVGAA